ncbi:MAG TPA: hypothetical protein VLF69_06230 [Candidatus Saccharimonadales bacterium]|nr:hypothetical protein [Candidatus Saccharimonadales bacterium]
MDWELHPALTIADEREERMQADRERWEALAQQGIEAVMEAARAELEEKNWVFMPDDSVLGFGEPFTKELTRLFNSGAVQRVKHDTPRGRKRARRVEYAHLLEGGGEDDIFIVGADSTSVHRSTDSNIAVRPHDYPTFPIEPYPLLRLFQRRMILLTAPRHHGIVQAVTAEVGTNMFDVTGLAATTKIHRDGEPFGFIRVESRDARWGRTQIYTNSKVGHAGRRATVSAEIPVGGLLIFRGNPEHAVTTLLPPNMMGHPRVPHRRTMVMTIAHYPRAFGSGT